MQSSPEKSIHSHSGNSTTKEREFPKLFACTSLIHSHLTGCLFTRLWLNCPTVGKSFNCLCWFKVIFDLYVDVPSGFQMKNSREQNHLELIAGMVIDTTSFFVL